jgi:hypothetical protein
MTGHASAPSTPSDEMYVPMLCASPLCDALLVAEMHRLLIQIHMTQHMQTHGTSIPGKRRETQVHQIHLVMHVPMRCASPLCDALLVVKVPAWQQPDLIGGLVLVLADAAPVSMWASVFHAVADAYPRLSAIQAVQNSAPSHPIVRSRLPVACGRVQGSHLHVLACLVAQLCQTYQTCWVFSRPTAPARHVHLSMSQPALCMLSYRCVGSCSTTLAGRPLDTVPTTSPNACRSCDWRGGGGKGR